MAKYTVLLTPDVESDILESYDWGVRNWGADAAEKWVREIYKAIFGRLSQFPESCPLAPDHQDSNDGVRHLIVGRYRILFKIKDRTVVTLHVRGPYSESTQS